MAPRRLTPIAVVALLAVLLAGCATPIEVGGAASVSASPSPTCAVAAQPGVEPPPGCIVYDVEDNMAANEAYRERIAQSDEGRAAGQALIEPVTTALTALRESGATLTVETVSATLVNAGVSAPDLQIYEDYGDILFGAAVAGGVCIFGRVSADAATVETGGFIMDGGCLAAVGH